MAVNESKMRDSRFWDVWRRAGAVARPADQKDGLATAMRKIGRDIKTLGGIREIPLIELLRSSYGPGRSPSTYQAGVPGKFGPVK